MLSISAIDELLNESTDDIEVSEFDVLVELLAGYALEQLPGLWDEYPVWNY